MKLTQTRIEGLKCPPAKRDMLVFDGEQRGLGVCASHGGRQQHFIGAIHLPWAQAPRSAWLICSAVSLAKARDAVRAIMGDVAKGIDPAAERKKADAEARRKAAHEALTLCGAAIGLANPASGRASGRAMPPRPCGRCAMPFLGISIFPLSILTGRRSSELLDAMARKGSVAMAARTAAYGKAAYGWAVKRGALFANPFLNLPVARASQSASACCPTTSSPLSGAQRTAPGRSTASFGFSS